MSKIKILYITQSFGGVFTYIRQIVERINRDLFDLVVIAPPDASFDKFAVSHSVSYHKVKMSRGFKPLTDVKNVNDFKRIIRREKPDIIHLHSSKAGFVGRIAASQLKTKCIFTPHGVSYLSFTGNKRSGFFTLENYAKKFTDRILACSYSEAFRLAYEVGVPERKITSLLNAISIPKTEPSKKIFNKETDKIKIGVIARLTYQKNPLLFVEIADELFKRYPNIEFSILGAGLEDHLKDATEQKIREHGLSECFNIYNWGDPNTSKTYLDELDIFLMTSIFEGLPFSLLEAMAKGVLCVTSKCDGCNDVIQNNINGLACMVAEEYVSAISYLIEHPEIQSHIRYNAFKYLESKHNIDNFITELEKYYIDVHKGNYHL